MQLQTFVTIDKPDVGLINYSSKILLLGSCFSNHIGNLLEYHKFDVLQNPYGILFHPIAIENLIKNSVQQKQIKRNELVLQDEIWHCLDTHSNVSDANADALLNKIDAAHQQTFGFVKKATHVIITLGTAWVYKQIASDKIVANCHKIPQKYFEKILLTVPEIEESLQNIINQIQQLNKEVNVIFTVSPVRHAKNGLIENNVSKAHLITAIHKVVNNADRLFYFPSYEIMMDELRDYRFYAEDMLHPNQTAINYIWDKFSQKWIDEQAKILMQQIDEVQKGLQHKPFNPKTEKHQQFLKKLAQKIEIIKQNQPNIKF